MKFKRFLAVMALAAFAFSASPVEPVQQAYLKASTAGFTNLFGWAVAISGETMVVGALNESSGATNSGAAYVFIRTGTNWYPQASLKASNAGAPDQFGNSVAISGDTIIVGASGESSNAVGVNGNQANNSATNAGAAYVFVRNGINWTQQAYLKPSNTRARDRFGVRVAISGDTVIVGALFEDSNATGVNGDQNDSNATNSGAAYIFVRSGTNWTQQAYLKASNTRHDMNFGAPVAIDGDTALVSAPVENSNGVGVNGNQNDESAYEAGAAYVFVRDGTNWSQQAYLKASNTDPGDLFGWAAALSGDTILIGAPWEDSAATGVNGNQTSNGLRDSGAGYVFVRSGTNWTQQAYLKAADTRRTDAFGRAVALSGETALIGTPASVLNPRVVHVFLRSGTNWGQQASLIPAASQVFDAYGFSMAFAGETAVIGAPFEDSNATGVNGDETNNGELDSGAAYVFAGVGSAPQLTIVPDGSGGYFIRSTSAVMGFNYRLERAITIPGPWTTNSTLTALSPDTIEFQDTNAPLGQAFYRLVHQ